MQERLGIPGLQPPVLMLLLDGIAVDIYTDAFSSTAFSNYMRQFLAPPPNFYETLGVPRTATSKMIKKAFRDLSRTLHPDKAKDGKGDPEGFARVTRAYENLVEADKRSM